MESLRGWELVRVMRAESYYRILLSLLAFILSVIFFALPFQTQERAAPTHPTHGLAQFRNAAPGAAYVGSKACAECHLDIYESYRETDMGRAMSLASEAKTRMASRRRGNDRGGSGGTRGHDGERGDDRTGQTVTVKHPKANRYYQVYRRGSDLYQSEYELDAQGKEVFRDEHKVDYILGAGANGFSGIFRRGDFLFEAPLSYYTRAQAWELSPGYEQVDYGFNRPIPADCTQCHSGRPQPVENTEGKFRQPPFLELPIGCESCHGPGALHVEERRKAAPLASRLDTSIVNPAKLPGWLADNICMDCHQGDDARALMPGKSYADFRPGTPLADTLAIFAAPFRRHAPPTEPLLQHFVLMTLSQCYLKSAGKLACITCHDPHRQPSPREAPAFFRARCLTCHTEKSCALPLAARRAKRPPDDCAGCHMPKQRLREISHSSLTDHRIPARAGEPLPESAFHSTTPELPDLVFLDAIPQFPRQPIPEVTLLRAYGELLPSHPQYRERFDSILDSLEHAGSGDPAVLSALARRKLAQGSAESQAAAADLLQRAIQAGLTDAFDFEQLATLKEKAGRTLDAIQTAKHGLEVNPYSPRLYRLLAALYISAHAYDDALKIMRQDVALFPEDSFMRTLLEKTERVLQH